MRTTNSGHGEPIAPNLLTRHCALADHPAPDRAWCGDPTYIPTREGWLFLAVLLDLATRRVVGWATGATLATALPLAALHQALRLRRPPRGLIQHTDRGSQYASQEYRAVLAAHGIRPSMSREGDCWDNAVAESFFATLEHELLADADFHTRREAHGAVAAFIDTWYNGERRHSTLGYVSPAPCSSSSSSATSWRAQPKPRVRSGGSGPDVRSAGRGCAGVAAHDCERRAHPPDLRGAMPLRRRPPRCRFQSSSPKLCCRRPHRARGLSVRE